MKTSVEMLDRMEALCRKLANAYDEANKNTLGFSSMPPDAVSYIDHASFIEARAIVSELPEPVDPDKKLLLDLNEEAGAPWGIPEDEDEWSMQGLALGFALAALRRAREEGVK